MSVVFSCSRVPSFESGKYILHVEHFLQEFCVQTVHDSKSAHADCFRFFNQGSCGTSIVNGRERCSEERFERSPRSEVVCADSISCERFFPGSHCSSCHEGQGEHDLFLVGVIYGRVYPQVQLAFLYEFLGLGGFSSEVTGYLDLDFLSRLSHFCV